MPWISDTSAPSSTTLPICWNCGGTTRFAFAPIDAPRRHSCPSTRACRPSHDAARLQTFPVSARTLAREINELLDSGRLRYHDHLKSTVPEGLPALLRLPSLTVQQVRSLWQQHRVTSLKQLAQAYRADRTPLDAATLAVLGRDLAAWERDENRMLLGIARPRAEALVRNLAKLQTVQRIEITGSIRRGTPLVGDINLVMSAGDPEGLMRYCRRQPEVTQILDSGTTSAAMLISEGLRVSLTAVPPAQFAGALLLGTGSAAHVAALQRRAQHQGWRLSEHAAAKEADLYERLGLPFIAPELREDRGEIEAAEADTLPRLVSQHDVLGDFRVGSHWGDGANGLDQIARAARKMGYQYVTVCDAAYSAATGRGLSPEELEQQIASIELMNAALPDDFRLLAGVEVDLSPDGDLQGPAELLQACDVVVAAARTGLKEPRRQLTRRLCRAMENPLVHVLAPPPWRQTGDPEMPPIDVDTILENRGRHPHVPGNQQPLPAPRPAGRPRPPRHGAWRHACPRLRRPAHPRYAVLGPRRDRGAPRLDRTAASAQYPAAPGGDAISEAKLRGKIPTKS